MISAMVSAGLESGYLAEPRLAKVHSEHQALMLTLDGLRAARTIPPQHGQF